MKRFKCPEFGNRMITIPNRKEDIRSLIEMLRIAHEHATD